MQHANFRSKHDKVSRLGFGAMGLGGAFGSQDEKESIKSVLNCLEQGVNFIDTARAYGNSERNVGLALKEWKGERPFIATKLESKSPGNIGWGMPIPVESAYPLGWLRKSTEVSLEKNMSILLRNDKDLI